MDFSFSRSVRIVALVLLLLAATQALYTGLYVAELTVPRQALWGVEGLLFVTLAAFAGAAMVQDRRMALGWSAIAFSAVLNVVQVGVGLTLFGPFREVAHSVEALAPVAGAVVAFSFFVYNAAKILLGLAALSFGRWRLQEGARLLGRSAVAVGLIAVVANAAVMVMGRGSLIPSPVAGASGVLATVLLALCLWSHTRPTEPKPS